MLKPSGFATADLAGTAGAFERARGDGLCDPPACQADTIMACSNIAPPPTPPRPIHRNVVRFMIGMPPAEIPDVRIAFWANNTPKALRVQGFEELISAIL